MTNPNYGTDLFAWIVDDPTGKHGIPAFCDPGSVMLMPMIASKRETVEKLRRLAEDTAKQTGCTVQLMHFTFAAVIDEVKP